MIGLPDKPGHDGLSSGRPKAGPAAQPMLRSLTRAGYGPVIVTAVAANSTVFAVRVIA